MNKKLFIIFVLYISGTAAFSDAIIQSNYYSRPTSIQSGVRSVPNVIYRNSDRSFNIDQRTYKAAVSELKKRIETNPDNKSTYIDLAGLYIRNEDYKNAQDCLLSIKDIQADNKTRKEADNLVKDLKFAEMNDHTKAYIYGNMALLSIIAGDKGQAESCLNTALNSLFNPDFMRPVIVEVLKKTTNNQYAIAICNKALARNPEDNTIRKLKADFLTKAGLTTEAADEYARVINSNPSDKEALYTLYKQTASSDDSDKVLLKKIYRIERPEKRDYERMYSDLADVSLKHGDTKNAMKYSKLLVEKFPDNADGYIILSEVYRRDGNLKEAYEVLEKAKNKANNNEQISKYNVTLAKMSDAPLKEANSLMNAGLYKQALEVLDSADDQSDLRIILAQSKAAYFAGYKQKALDYLNKATVMHPDNPEVYAAFAYIYLNEKDSDSAQKYIEKALQKQPDNQSYLAIQDAVKKSFADKLIPKISNAVDIQDYAKAQKYIDEALKIDSKNAQAYYYKGLILISKNDYQNAVKSLNKCTEYSPGFAPAYYSLGVAYDNLSDKQNALKNYGMYLNKLPQDSFSESEKKEYAKARILKIRSAKQ